MKCLNYFLSTFLLVVLFLASNYTFFKHKKLDLSLRIQNRALSTLTTGETDFSGFFWKQTFNPTKDPEKYIKEADRFNQYEYLHIDNEKIRFHPDKLHVNRVTTQINLYDIYDQDNDNMREGKCCTRVVYYEYPKTECHGKKCIIERQRLKMHPPSQDMLERDPLTAVYCVHIFIYEQASIRICNRNKDMILKLKNTITFGVLKTIPGVNPSEVMKKFIQHTSYAPLTAPESWNWHDQSNWGGNCNAQIMQSPINVIAPVKGEKGNTSLDFSIDYKFERKVPFYITVNGVEIVMKFTGNPGAFKIIYSSDGTMLSFQPHTMTFRFPAEHLINGYRMDGEIVLLCREITPKDNKAYTVTNGMEFVIPLRFHPNGPDYKEFSSLTPEMWRKELEDDDDKEYIPRDVLTGKNALFDFHSFMKRVMGLKSDFSMYLGTQTTPPCQDHVLQIIGNRPLVMKDCLFKELRENSLLSEQTKEIHARQLQFNTIGGPSIIKNLRFAQFKYQSNLHNLTPERRYAHITVKVGKKLLRKKVPLFGRNKCGLEKTYQLPHYDRLT